MRIHSIVLVVLISIGFSSHAEEKLIVKIVPVSKIEAVQTFDLVTTQGDVDRWTICCAAAPEHPAQTKTKSSLEPGGKLGQEVSNLKRPILAASIPAKTKALKHKISLKVTHGAVLMSRILEPVSADMAPPPKPLPPAAAKLALATSSQLDFKDAAFQKWLDTHQLRRVADDDEIAFAVRVLQVIRDGFAYKYQQNVEQQVSIICGNNKTDCSGMSNLFVAALRANGIPARVLFGRLAKSRDPKAKPGDAAYEQYHCRAEFYSASAGNWVPAEPTFAQGNKKHDARKFIGYDPGDMLILHVDPDFVLKFADKQEAVSALQSYFFRVTTKGTVDIKEGATDWQVKVTDLK